MTKARQKSKNKSVLRWMDQARRRAHRQQKLNLSLNLILVLGNISHSFSFCTCSSGRHCCPSLAAHAPRSIPQEHEPPAASIYPAVGGRRTPTRGVSTSQGTATTAPASIPGGCPIHPEQVGNFQWTNDSTGTETEEPRRRRRRRSRGGGKGERPELC